MRLQTTSPGSPILFNTDNRGFTTVSAPPERITRVVDARAAHDAARDSGAVGGVFVFTGRYSRPFGDGSGVCKIPSTAENPLVLLSEDIPAEVSSAGTGAGFTRQGVASSDNLTVLGLKFSILPGESGVSHLGPGTNMRYEDCEVVGGMIAFNIQGDSNGSPRRPTVFRSRIRGQRNHNGNHALAVFVAGDRECQPIVQENLIDDVAHRTATMRDQAVYIQNGSGAATVGRNIIVRGPSHAIQARSGGVVQGNVMARCPCFVLSGGGDHPEWDVAADGVTQGIRAIVRHNYLQEPTDAAWDGGPTAWGLEFSNAISARAFGNIFNCGRKPRGRGFAIRFRAPHATTAGTNIGCKTFESYDNAYEGSWPGGLEIEPQMGVNPEIGPSAIASGRCIQTYHAELQGRDGTQPGDFDAFVEAAWRATTFGGYDPRYTAQAFLEYAQGS